MDRGDVRAQWVRVVACLAASVSGLYLLAVLGFGLLWVTTDLSATCFDGDDPGCTDLAQSDTGLSAIQSSSWLLGAVAMIAVVGALVLSFRLRRVAHAIPVLLLCATSAVIAETLASRL